MVGHPCRRNDLGGNVTAKPRATPRDETTPVVIRSVDRGEVRSLALVTTLAAAQRGRKSGGASSTGASSAGSSGAGTGGGASSRGVSGPSARAGLVSESELRRIEQEHQEGLTAAQIVDLFASRGLRFSEATFRKYVQLGLVPRSRRVGRKGKHRGSLGVYPAKAVRRINVIRRLMDEGRTIEEIQSELLQFADLLETVGEGIDDLVQRFEAEIAQPRFDARARKNFQRDLAEARQAADELIERLDDLSHRLTRPRDDTTSGSGAAGSAEELL
jgi:DNA-binding transcriptional MerR regulator